MIIRSLNLSQNTIKINSKFGRIDIWFSCISGLSNYSAATSHTGRGHILPKLHQHVSQALGTVHCTRTPPLYHTYEYPVLTLWSPDHTQFMVSSNPISCDTSHCSGAGTGNRRWRRREGELTAAGAMGAVVAGWEPGVHKLTPCRPHMVHRMPVG